MLEFETSPSSEKVKQVMKALQKDVKDWRPAWKELAPLIADEMQGVIRSQGRTLGVRWRPYAQSTLLRGKGTTGQLLVRSGKLLRMLGTKKVEGKAQLKVGIRRSERYMYAQNFGSKKRGLPARPFVGLTRKMVLASEAAMQKHAQMSLDTAAKRINRG